MPSTDPASGDGAGRPAFLILVAVEEELKAIRKRMPSATLGAAGGFSVWRGVIGGVEVAIAKSGMGPDRAANAASILLTTMRPEAVLICGFCAGIDPRAAPGDLVVPTIVSSIDGAGRQQKVDDRLSLSLELPRSEHILEMPGITFRRGLLVTVDEVVRTSREKEAFASKHGAVALDMESAAAAEEADSTGVPWLVVRAVTDGVADDLPLPFDRLVSPRTGEPSLSRILLHAASHPWKLPALMRLGARSQRAARNLGAFVELYVRAFAERSAASDKLEAPARTTRPV